MFGFLLFSPSSTKGPHLPFIFFLRLMFRPTVVPFNLIFFFLFACLFHIFPHSPPQPPDTIICKFSNIFFFKRFTDFFTTVVSDPSYPKPYHHGANLLSHWSLVFSTFEGTRWNFCILRGLSFMWSKRENKSLLSLRFVLIKLFHFIELRRAGERQSVCVTVKQIKWDLGKLETHTTVKMCTHSMSV